MVLLDTIIGIVIILALIIVFIILCKKWGKSFFYISLVGFGIYVLSGSFGDFLLFVGIISYFKFIK